MCRLFLIFAKLVEVTNRLIFTTLLRSCPLRPCLGIHPSTDCWNLKDCLETGDCNEAIVSVRDKVLDFKSFITLVRLLISLFWLTNVQCKHKYRISDSPSSSKVGWDIPAHFLDRAQLCRPHNVHLVLSQIILLALLFLLLLAFLLGEDIPKFLLGFSAYSHHRSSFTAWFQHLRKSCLKRYKSWTRFLMTIPWIIVKTMKWLY